MRLATPADARVLAGLRYDFRSALNPAVEPEEAFVARCSDWMAERLAPPSPWRCWVYERDTGVSGHIWLQLIEKIPNPAPELERHAYITNVYVRPDARGSGAGKALLEAALSFCTANAVDSVILWPTDRSRTLYARHGFAVRADLMEAILDGSRQL